VAAPHVGPDGEFRWPADQDKRDELASDLLGAELVGSLDAWLELAYEPVRNASPSAEWRRTHSTWETDDRFREGFATLTPEQRALVEDLVSRTAEGLLFSLLVDLDQFPCGNLDLVVSDSDSGEPLASIMAGSMLDLHDRLGEWVERFSEYTAQLRRASP